MSRIEAFVIAKGRREGGREEKRGEQKGKGKKRKKGLKENRGGGSRGTLYSPTPEQW